MIYVDKDLLIKSNQNEQKICHNQTFLLFGLILLIEKSHYLKNGSRKKYIHNTSE